MNDELYAEYLKKRGIVDVHENILIKHNYVDISSKDRQKCIEIKSNKILNLIDNPLSVDQIDDTILWIELPEKYFQIDDKILISGLTGKLVTIRNITLDGINVVHTIEFTNGSKYLQININPNMSGNPIQTFDNSNLLVEISGFCGDNSTQYIGNISVNFLNSVHKILLQTPDDIQNNIPINFTKFYIELDREFVGIINNDPFIGFNVNFNFLEYGGITIDEINNIHTVVNVSQNSIAIKLPRETYYQNDFGGNYITVSSVDKISVEFPNSNNYFIQLNKCYSNVFMTTIISSNFTNTARNVIKDKNDKLYWQNQDDDTTIYSIQIPDGYYQPDKIIPIIENLFSNTLRTINNSPYLQNNFAQVTINEHNNLVEFESKKIAQIEKPIIDITPNPLLNDVGTYIVTILLNNHRLQQNDNISFENFISDSGISNIYLNNNHIVNGIIDENTFTIQITGVNLLQDFTNTGGGFNCKIYVPNNFRLLFNFTDTIGNLLGFRNVGMDKSITNYSNIIKNSGAYIFETESKQQNKINFNTDEYFYICSPELIDIVYDDMKNNCVNQIFTKINIDEKYGEQVVDTFVKSSMLYQLPKSIRNINFRLMNKNNEYYDTQNIDHSFTIDIVTYEPTPYSTKKSSKIILK